MLTKETESRLSKVVRHLGHEPPAAWRGCDVFLGMLERMRHEGAVVVVKLDGERTSPSDAPPYTVVISRGGLGDNFTQRSGKSLEEALATAVLDYAQQAWSL